MNVSFLGKGGVSAKSAIMYNHKKVVESKAFLIDKDLKNLIIDNIGLESINDTILAFERWNSMNERVKDKNKILHIAISCKGAEYTHEELSIIGKEWLRKMGYDNVPYVIYGHKDTDNNHIHIVTSRIDEYGKKIKDNNEAYRGKDILNDIEKKYKNITIDNILNKAYQYKFSTPHQFALLIEKEGYNTKITGNTIQIKDEKGESHFHNIDIQEFEKEEKQIKKIRAILYKYSMIMDLYQLQKELRTKFGYEIIFYGDKGKPTGYTLIDHKNKTIYKGSELVKLKVLQQQERKFVKEEKKAIKDIELLVDAGKHTGAINKILGRKGIKIGKGYVVTLHGKEIELPEELKERLKYNNRLWQVNKYKIENEKQLDILAKIYRINREDLKISKSDIEALDKIEYQRLYESGEYEGMKNIILSGNSIIDMNNNIVVNIELDEDIKVGLNKDNISNEEESLGIEDISIPKDMYIGAGGDNQTKKRRRR